MAIMKIYRCPKKTTNMKPRQNVTWLALFYPHNLAAKGLIPACTCHIDILGMYVYSDK